MNLQQILLPASSMESGECYPTLCFWVGSPGISDSCSSARGREKWGTPTKGFQPSSSSVVSLPRPDALAVRAEKSIVGSFLNNLPRKEISVLGSWLLLQSGHIPAIFCLNPA